MIATKSAALTESQKDRVIVMLEGKSFDEVASKIDTVIEIISETEDVLSRNETILEENDNTDVFTGSTEPITESVVVNEKSEKEVKFGKALYLLGE